MPNNAPRYTASDIEKGKQLFSGSCMFMLGVAGLEQLPPDNIVDEIAFAGRSNVGKSSLINALTDRKTLAKTSTTPGRTQQLNFFNLSDKLYLVDMPGYGFAEAPEALVKKWQRMIFAYLQGRANLKRVFLLIDARHGIKKVDTEIMEMLDKAAVNYQIVLTKTDKISAVELAKITTETNKILKEHAAAHIDVMATSSEKKHGIEELRAEIAKLII